MQDVYVNFALKKYLGFVINNIFQEIDNIAVNTYIIKLQCKS